MVTDYCAMLPRLIRRKLGDDRHDPSLAAVGARGNCVDGVLKASRVGDNLIELFGDDRR